MTECPLVQLLFSANKCPRMHITMFQLYIPLSKASRSVEKRALAQRGGGYVNRERMYLPKCRATEANLRRCHTQSYSCHTHVIL